MLRSLVSYTSVGYVPSLSVASVSGFTRPSSQLTQRKLFNRRVLLSVGPLLGWLALALTANAQVPNTDQVGIVPSGTYIGGNVDQINVSNGNLTVRIPLYSLPQKGALDLSLSVTMNSTSVTVSKDCEQDVPATIDGPGTKYCNVQYAINPVDTRIGMDQGLGLRSGTYSNLYGFTQCSEDYGDNLAGWSGPWPGSATNCMTFTSIVQEPQHSVFDATGAEHYLAFDQTTSYATLRTVDGSGIQENTGDPNAYKDGATGPLYDAKGLKYQFNAGTSTSSITDPNGNSISIAANGLVTDSLGRQFASYPHTSEPISSCPTLSYPNQSLANAVSWSLPGPADTPNSTIKFIFCYATVNIRTGILAGYGVSGPDLLGISGWETFNNFSYNVTTDYHDYVNSYPELQSIVLPDGTYWAFAYESADPTQTSSIAYGSLVSIREPLGGTITYPTPTPAVPCVRIPDQSFYSLSDMQGGAYPYYPFSLPYLGRTVSDGQGTSGAWGYNYPTALIPTSTVTDPNGNQTVYQFTSFDACQLLESGSKTYDGAASPSKTPRRTTQRNYTDILSPSYNVVGIQIIGPPHIPSVTSETTTLDTGATTTTTYTHGASFNAAHPGCSSNVGNCVPAIGTISTMSLGLLTGTTVMGSDGHGGTLTGTTTTDYKALHDLSYYAANLFNLPSTVTVSGTGGNSSVTTYGYDDPALGPAGIRGNLTSVSKTGSLGGSTSSSRSYNTSGQVLSVTDGNGTPTSYTYGSSTAASATLVTYPTLNGVAHTESYTWDPNTGVKTSYTDQNGIVTNYRYVDPFGRISEIDSAVGTSVANKTKYDYSTANSVKVSMDMNTYGDGALSATTVMDGLGRAVKSIDAAGIATKTVYGPAGNVQSVSNPYPSTGSPSAFTSFAYDSLGRKVLQCDTDNGTSPSACAPGAAFRQWTYNGSTVTTQDEAGVQSQQTGDALGHLTKVVESGALSTTYTYDSLGNLKCVDQWSTGLPGTACASTLARSFVYDSLSRLIASHNPESGTICYGTTTDGLAPNLSGSNCSHTTGYDGNGNILAKTDARNVVTNYTYDVLNRILQRQSAGGTGIAGFNHTFGYDKITPVAQPNLVGRLVWTNNNVNTNETYSYDPMGRVTIHRLGLPSNTAPPWLTTQVSTVYNLAGAVTDLTYPDGRHVRQTMDSANRLYSSAMVDIGGVAQSQTYLASVTYNLDGSPNTLTLGNGVQQTIAKNTRLQVQSLAVSATSGPMSGATLLSHTYCYTGCTTGGVANNGNIWGITDTLKAANTQGFTYDSFNRIGNFSLNDVLNQKYDIDPFGNMSLDAGGVPVTTFDSATNRIDNLPCASSLTPYDASGNQMCSTDANGAISHYAYNADGQISQIALLGYESSPFVSYVYNPSGTRVRKNNASGTYTEYVDFGGQPMAEKDQTGAWTDYIYANGQKIARASSNDTRLHLSGDNCTSCGGPYRWFWFPPVPPNLTFQVGTKLAFRQYQSGSAQPEGGIFMITNTGTYLNWGVPDQNGQSMNSLPTQGTWVQRTVDLSAFAGQSPGTLGIGSDGGTGPGHWDIYMADVAFIQPDGTVIAIYNGQQASGWGQWGDGGVQSPAIVSESVAASTDPTSAGSLNTHYFLDDHLGTAQMELSAGGWPVWHGQFAPFGQELDTQPTSTHYKFTGKERDAESGLDYFGARYYGSSNGRFISPDPSGLLAQTLQHPQSWNLYAYARNNPLIFIDPTGLDCVYVNDAGDNVESIDHDSNSAECSTNGGTWLRGYADENWVQFNRTSGLFEGASIANGDTVDFTQFGAGAKTSYDGLCLQGCDGFDTSSADTNWLQGMLVGRSKPDGVDGLLTFMAGRDEKVHGDGWNRLFSGPGFSANAPDNWAGPGGMGVPQGQGDWAAAVHDFNYNTNGIKISSYINPILSPQTARALIESNDVLIRNAGGSQSVKMQLFFRPINVYQLLLNAWR